MKEGRVIPMTIWVGVKDVMHALHCGKTTAAKHLRAAGAKSKGHGALLLVPLPIWEVYAKEVFGWSDCEDGVASGTARSGKTGSVWSGRRNVGTRRPHKRSSGSGNVTPPIPITRPRGKRR